MDGEVRQHADTVDFARFEGVGIPPRTAWLASAVLYGIASATFIVLPFVIDSVPIGIAAVGTFGMMMAAFCLVGSRRFTYAWWGGHVRSGTGMAIVCVGAVVIGEVHGATSMIMIYPMAVAAFMFDWRRALPYASIAVTYFYVSLALVGDPTAHPVATGTTVAAIAIAIMISQSELRSIVNVNRDLSVTDALTGVANVRHLRAELDAAITHSGDRGVALYAIDLDDFKQVNDQFSHTRGDEVLKAVAEAMSEALDPGDLLVRRGGDEFSVLLTNAAERDLDRVADDLEHAIARARNNVCPEVNPQGSVAYVLHIPGEGAEELLERCDAQLHETKLDVHPERRGARLAVVRSIGPERRIGGRSDHFVAGCTETISEDLAMARTIRRALGGASAWNVFCVTNVAAALAILGSLATDTGAELQSRLPLVAAIGLLAHGIVAGLASRGRAGVRLMHFHLVTSVALISMAVWSAGPLSASLADLYLLPVVCAVYAFDSRRLPIYLATCVGLFAATLFTTGYEFPFSRLVVTGSVTLVTAGMLARARKFTHEFTENAVELSTIDALTGVANLRGMRRSVAIAIERCTRTGDTLVLVTVDLDDFKLVNDFYSHTMGDRVLARVAAAMTEVLRDTDLIARRGGDEFAAVCIIDSGRTPARVRAALREAIRVERVSLTPNITPTASIGSVAWRDGENVDDFLARADEELHFAKLDSRTVRGVADLKSA